MTTTDATATPAMRRPRPRALPGALLVVAGAVVTVVGAFLPWFSIDGLDYDGFAAFADGDGGTSATTFVSLAIVAGTVGLVTLLGRRVVPVAVAGVLVGAAIAVLAFARRGDLDDAADRYAGVVELGPGTMIVAIGGIVVTIGSLLVLVIRRRRP